MQALIGENILRPVPQSKLYFIIESALFFPTPLEVQLLQTRMNKLS